jgi:hypothetical protein
VIDLRRHRYPSVILSFETLICVSVPGMYVRSPPINGCPGSLCARVKIWGSALVSLALICALSMWNSAAEVPWRVCRRLQRAPDPCCDRPNCKNHPAHNPANQRHVGLPPTNLIRLEGLALAVKRQKWIQEGMLVTVKMEMEG